MTADADSTNDGGSVRIDRWLWAARMYKTRSQATKACAGGLVELNGESAKPAKQVRVGDTVGLTRGTRRFVLEVAALSEKRGPAAVAQTLYVDHSPPPPPKRLDDVAPRPRGAGRPVKRERRLLIRFRGDRDD